MRPVRIEVEGFAAFRDRAVVDLVDTDLFALVGPTGAGKSTVIDAMVFALYGSVPRYGSKTLVYPVITQGALEARVRLDFMVGADTYTATRVVRRTKTGASTKEARLERDDAVLADDADGLTSAVAALLGLDLEQFTKCVVLPQGAFATLLHDTKATRQDLLVKLLDLGLYERLAGAARAETKRAAQRIELLDEQLARSVAATPEVVAAAAAEVATIDAIVAELDAAAPVLASLDERITAAEATAAEATRAITSLSAVAAPDDINDIDRQAAEAVAALEAAEEREREATTAVAAAAEEVDALPEAASLQTVADDRATLADLVARIDKGTTLLREVETSIEEARRGAAAAAETHRSAEAHRERARVTDAAADLARHLHEGDDCPVCGNEIESLPTIDTSVLADADAEVSAAAKALHQATAHVEDQERTAAGYRATLAERIEERDRLAARLADTPTPEEIEATLARITAATETLRAARSADDAARTASKQARTVADSASAQVAGARAAFTRVRDSVAALAPPSPTDELARDWKELLQWAHGAVDERMTIRDVAQRDREDAMSTRTARLGELDDLAQRGGIEPGPAGSLRDRCVARAAAAQAERRQLERDLAVASELRTERESLDERRQVHDLLAEQLGARGFEAWLLDEALDALLDGASTWLELLSSARYAMAVDDKKQFTVVDHANADEHRIARTLSGGETFLASLALALALAERVSELSATGGGTLDAIFLDEGFGTLDPDTLDVVATAIEELGATGRMVGIISHVADLAERVPVRFEVTKSPGSSRIERVEA